MAERVQLDFGAGFEARASRLPAPPPARGTRPKRTLPQQIRLDEYLDRRLDRAVRPPSLRLVGKPTTDTKPRSLGIAPLTPDERDELDAMTALLALDGTLSRKPRTLAACPPPGPCPWVSCRYNLYLDVDDTRATPVVRLNFPGLEVWELPETCAMRAARLGGMTLEAVAMRLNVDKMVISRIIESARERLKAAVEERTEDEDRAAG